MLVVNQDNSDTVEKNVRLCYIFYVMRALQRALDTSGQHREMMTPHQRVLQPEGLPTPSDSENENFTWLS